MTRVLVTAASKHDATGEIAEAIGQTLSDHGVEAVVTPPGEAPGPEGFDAVVLGSAVYAGHWLKPALAYAEEHQDALAGLPVWMFSSGPVGDPPRPIEEPADAVRVAGEIGAREHRLFSGRLDPTILGRGERLIVKAMRAPRGDFREWAAITGWGTGIAAELGASRARKET